jgi:hypothetical protein
MVRGEGGKFGILGNVGSTSYGSHWAGQGPNPTLSAMLLKIDKLLKSPSPLSGAHFVFGMSGMQFCTAQVRAVKAKNRLIGHQFLDRKDESCRPGSVRPHRGELPTRAEDIGPMTREPNIASRTTRR